jgi:two-component system OmpR family sensor kinase
MRRLTARLLLLAATDGPGSVRLSPVDVEEIVVEAARRWSHVPRRWTLGATPEAWAMGDKDRLTQALDALIENAVAHTGPDGAIEISLCRDGEDAVISVSDSGPGIPPDEVDRIFGRFSRIDAGRSREAGGFGLGLAIVKAIADAHHGSVGVSSTVGAGSVFEMRLPASAPAAVRRSAALPVTL